jgi:DNA polymerase III delta subunit
MIIALFGGDEARIRDRLYELRDEADGGSGMLDSNLNTVDGRDVKPADVLGPVMSVPFLSAKRLVIVEHLLERYEPRYDARNGPRGGRVIGPLQPLFEALAQGIPETTILVFLGLPFLIEQRTATVSKRNPVVQEIAKLPGAIIEEYPSPDTKSLPAYIEREAKARGLRLRQGKRGFAPGEEVPRDAGPAALLAALTQGNTLAIANELDKLALYTGGGEVTMADVNRVCAGERLAGQFELGDAVLDGNLARALEVLQLLRDSGEDPAATIFNLASTYRRLAPVVELVSENAPAEEIASAMGNAGRHPGLRDAAIRRARRLGLSGLRQAFEALIAADRDSKAGIIERDLALDLAIARLCALATR